MDAVRFTLKLKYGVSNPVKSYLIEEKLGLSGPEVRAIIHYLRTEGCPIGSCSQGYFYARDMSELESTVTHLSQRRNSIDAVLNGLRQSFMENKQEALFENQINSH